LARHQTEQCGTVVRKRLSRDERQRHLVQATLSAIHKYGFHDATVLRIAEEAGLSGGNIHYHFKSKEELFAAAMRALMSDLSDLLVEQLAGAETPLERLRATISANLSERIFTEQTCFVWLQFWSETSRHEKLARLERINAGRFRGTLVDALKQLVPAGEADAIAHELIALVDGLWIRKAQTGDALSAAQARTVAFGYLDGRLESATRSAQEAC
jgi:TetR/AcrR family transcriptional repressor of bet genes